MTQRDPSMTEEKRKREFHLPEIKLHVSYHLWVIDGQFGEAVPAVDVSQRPRIQLNVKPTRGHKQSDRGYHGEVSMANPLEGAMFSPWVPTSRKIEFRHLQEDRSGLREAHLGGEDDI